MIASPSDLCLAGDDHGRALMNREFPSAAGKALIRVFSVESAFPKA
jgi:hypothetical protein